MKFNATNKPVKCDRCGKITQFTGNYYKIPRGSFLEPIKYSDYTTLCSECYNRACEKAIITRNEPVEQLTLFGV